MTQKAFQRGLWLIFLLGSVGLFLTIRLFSPFVNQDSLQVDILHLSIFYVCLLVFGTGLFTLILFWVRKKAVDEEVTRAQMGVSLRQGLLLSLMLVVIMILQSFRVLVWWDALLAVGAVMMIELYFLAR